MEISPFMIAAIVLGMIAVTVCICFLLSLLLKMLPAPTREQIEAREKEEKEQRRIESWGHINPPLVCPHCQSKGAVRTKQITQKTGVSGGKGTAAVLTGGLSLVVAGLSRKEDRTQCACEHCGMTWIV